MSQQTVEYQVPDSRERSERESIMKHFIASVVLAAVLLLALFSPVAVGRAHALVACQPLVHGKSTGGGVVCVGKHGHLHRWPGQIHRGGHFIAVWGGES